MRGAGGDREQFQDYVSNSFRQTQNYFGERAQSQGRAVG
jgi:hypothetical protein